MSSGLFNLTGKRALITGSSQGIGFALAKGLAAEGVEIVLNGRNAEKLASAARALEANGVKTHQLAFDATDHTAVRDAIDGFESASGAIDILVNNAGSLSVSRRDRFVISFTAREASTSWAQIWWSSTPIVIHRVVAPISPRRSSLSC